jgi:hypothetical protein
MRKEAAEWDTRDINGVVGLSCIATIQAGSWHTVVWRGFGGNVK